jgi:hypothetical protein
MESDDMGNKTITYRRKFSMYTNNNGVKTIYNSVHTLNNGRVASDRPMYKDVIRKRGNATNDLSAFTNTAKFMPSYASARGTGTNAGKTYETTTANPLPVTPSVINETRLNLASDIAATAIMKKILAQQQSFAGPQFLGELREAVKMLKRPAESLSKQLENYHRQLAQTLRFKNRKDWRKVIGDSWLEGCFGWAPIVSDIGAIAESALDRFNLNPIKRVTGVGTSEADLVQILNRTAGIASIYYDYEKRQESRRRVIFTAGVEAFVSRGNNGIERVIASSGLDNWQQAVPTAYELMPWSFLLDYFTNIGDAINAACTSTAGVVWSQRTTITENKCQFIGLRHTFSPSYPMTASRMGHAISTKRTVERTAASIPTPGLRFELPESNFKLGIIAALLTKFT